LREEDVARAGSEQRAAAIEEAEDVPAAAKPASVIATAAAQSANAGPGGNRFVDESVTQALGGGGESEAPPVATGKVINQDPASGSSAVRYSRVSSTPIRLLNKPPVWEPSTVAD
jgi:hypothetical protein